MKDLVNSPVKKYQDIFDTISNSNSNLNSNTNFNKYLPSDNDYTDINLLPTQNTNMNMNSSVPDMKDELKSFLKKQLNTSTTNELESGNSSSNFGSIF